MGKFSDLEGRNVPQFIPMNWADWEGDEHVEDMNETMQGVYWLIVKELWKFDAFEFDYTRLAKRIRAQDPRNVRTFLEKWGHLFACVECGGTVTPRWKHAESTQYPCRYCAAPTQCSCSTHAVFVHHLKLKTYKKTAKSGSQIGDKSGTKQSKEKKTNVTEAVAPSVSVSETKPTPSPVKSGAFDPLTFDEDVTPVPSKKYPRTEIYPGSDVHRILLYHFKHEPSDYWMSDDPKDGNVTSAIRVAKTINAMAEQVPAAWTPPENKPTKSRTVGDPSCLKCRGLGRVTVVQADGLSRASMECPACEKHQQVRKGGEWVDA
jgi:hypothetical protein